MLVVAVLLQPGKTSAGALFTSNVSSTSFGPRGSASILAKITIVAASIFMVSAFMISLPAFQGGGSMLQRIGDPGEAASPVVLEGEQPAENAPAEDAPPANADEQGVETPTTEPPSNVETPEATPEASPAS